MSGISNEGISRGKLILIASSQILGHLGIDRHICLFFNCPLSGCLFSVHLYHLYLFYILLPFLHFPKTTLAEGLDFLINFNEKYAYI